MPMRPLSLSVAWTKKTGERFTISVLTNVDALAPKLQQMVKNLAYDEVERRWRAQGMPESASGSFTFATTVGDPGSGEKTTRNAVP